jgi:hypothetical protein
MLKAFVGVASRHGLSVFQPERDDALSLLRRSVRPGARRCSFWAVVNDTDACSIAALFFDGKRKEAMIALERQAHEIGPILPSDLNRTPIQ